MKEKESDILIELADNMASAVCGLNSQHNYLEFLSSREKFINKAKEVCNRVPE
jgi:hypothetical protein